VGVLRPSSLPLTGRVETRNASGVGCAMRRQPKSQEEITPSGPSDHLPHRRPGVCSARLIQKDASMRCGALAVAGLILLAGLLSAPASAQIPDIAVGPQYDTTHVYVAPADMRRFVAAFIATFGGAAIKPAITHVTPTPSSAEWQAIQTSEGVISLFGFTTPIPYPFGAERTGYLVRDMDAAIAAAKAAGADVLVAPYPDPIGQDAVVQWPGGVEMQLYCTTRHRPIRRSRRSPRTVSMSRLSAPTPSCGRFSPSRMAR
jgi:hypothetical protein